MSFRISLRLSKLSRVYLGVGPEQNFTYIAALKPKMAFIVDVRRGNLQLHLMYKALFELSSDRADFVFRLFSTKRPEGLGTGSTANDIFAAVHKAWKDKGEANDLLYKQNLKLLQEHLTRKRHLALTRRRPEGHRVRVRPVLLGTVRAFPTGRPAVAAAAATLPLTGT